MMRVVGMEIYKGHNCCSPANHRLVLLLRACTVAMGTHVGAASHNLHSPGTLGAGAFPFFAHSYLGYTALSAAGIMATAHALMKFQITAYFHSRIKLSEGVP